MRRRAVPTLPPSVGHFCGHCGQGQHRSCPGTIPSGMAAKNAATACACALAGHDPDDVLAAWMRLYQRGDLVGDTTEHLAEEYRERST